MKLARNAAAVLAVILTLACWSRAIDVRLAWDPAPAGESWSTVRIYEKSSATPPVYTLVAEVAGGETTVTIRSVSVGMHNYVARAWNGQVESDDSNTALINILPQPKAPTTLTITIVR